MKKIILAIGLVFAFSGCSLEEYFTEKKAEEEFKSLCNRYTLAICNELKIPKYNNADQNEVKAVTYDIHFRYVADDGEQYDYMEEAPHRGDCEDWTITFIENNLRLGNIDKDEIKWIFGELNGNGHAWTLVTKNEETVLYDNGNIYGILKDYAYSERGYNEMFTVYSY